MRASLLSCLCMITNAALAAFHERLHEVPSDYLALGPAAGDELLSLRIYVAEAEQPYLKVAKEVSDPSSERYGQYLDTQQLQETLPNTSHSVKALLEWLQDHKPHVDNLTHAEHLLVTAPVSDWNTLLSTTFQRFRHRHTGSTVVRTVQYHVPSQYNEMIDYIYPTVHFLHAQALPDGAQGLLKRQRVPTGPSNCSNSVCPDELRKKYNINYTPKDNKSGSTTAVAGFLNNFPDVSDVKAFLLKYAGAKSENIPSIKMVSVNNGTLKPPKDHGTLTVEAELDLDYSMAFTGSLPVTFYSVGGHAPRLGHQTSPNILSIDNEPWAEFFEHVLALDNPPKVISISYSDDEKNIPLAYARRTCNLFAKAAARGISIIGSSGDGGASGGGGNTTCRGVIPGKLQFVPTFPSSCPWMTSVGATADYGGAASFSSGGFSNVFARPSWQDKAVTTYFSELKGKHRGYYNTTGRGIPDVSLLGDDYLTLTAGTAGIHDGTSASTPVFAAMIALINDMRLRSGKKQLGFLNPLLYSSAANKAYRDVKDGSNTIGCADGNSFEAGWEALKGWDAATGLGEPNFATLASILKA